MRALIYAPTRNQRTKTKKNIRKNPGKASLRFNVQESKINAKISLYSLENGFEMNDEMAAFLQDCPEFDVQVVSL